MIAANPRPDPSLDDRTGLSADERRLRAQAAAHTSWANTTDRTARTARFEKQADPDGILPPEERARRAEHLRKAHMAKLALASAKARRLKKEGGA